MGRDRGVVMPSPNVAVMLGGRAAFNPLALSPVYMTQTDSSTVTSGQVSAISDLVGAYTWSQATTTARPKANTTQVPGHTVWKHDDAVRRWLDRTDAALAGAIDGTPAFTMGCYMQVVTQPATDSTLLGHTISVTGYNPATRWQLRASSAGGGFTVIESNGGVTQYLHSSAGSPVPLDTSWHFYAYTYDGSGVSKFWSDGVQLGPNATGIDRSPTAMTHVTLGEAVLPSGAREFYVGGHFLCLGQLSSANMIKLKAWYAKSFGQ